MTDTLSRPPLGLMPYGRYRVDLLDMLSKYARVGSPARGPIRRTGDHGAVLRLDPWRQNVLRPHRSVRIAAAAGSRRTRHVEPIHGPPEPKGLRTYHEHRVLLHLRGNSG